MNTKMKTLFLTLVSLWLFNVGASGQQPIIEHEGARVPNTKEAVVSSLSLPKSLDLTAAVREGRSLFDLGPVTDAENATANEEMTKRRISGSPGPLRVGLVRPVGQSFGPASFINAAAPASDGEKQLWVTALRSPGAAALRLHFVNFDVGRAAVTVYTRDGDEVITRGPFSGKGPDHDGDFWTASLPSDTVFIELSGAGQPRLEIAELMHLEQDPIATAQKQRWLSKGQGQSNLVNAPAELGCHLDVACEAVDSFARDATVQLNYQTGPTTIGRCSGTILNDLDGETVVPYLLTANHCNITPANVGTLQVTFLFQRGSCGGSLPTNPPTLTGGVVLENNPQGGNDMTFIRLNGQLPAGVTMAGWSTGGPDNNSYGIHHPDGAFKRVTFFEPSSYLPCTLEFDDEYHIVNPLRGGIEGGSSGSGLFNGSGRLIGQLRGRCGVSVDGNGNCSSDDGWRAVYGTFAITYPIIRRWLEIGGTINVNLFHGGNELGTPSQPYRTVTGGYNLAWNNTRLKIKPGNYNERVTFSKPMTILADGGPVIIGR